jgi:hypothetical protein
MRLKRGYGCRHRRYVSPFNPNLSNFVVVTYLFRTTGQVLGVSLSGALFQGVLVGELRERMPGPDAQKVLSI